MSNSVVFGFVEELLQKTYGSVPNVNEINDSNRVLMQEKEQIKNELIGKEHEKLFVEYLGKDPEKWPSAEEAESQLKSSKQERRKVKEQYEEAKEKVSEVLKVVVEEFTACQSTLNILKEKLNLLEDKKSTFQAKRHIDPETVDAAIDKCQKCIAKLETEIQDKKQDLHRLETCMTGLRSKVQRSNQSVERAQKILSFLETSSGVSINTVDQNIIQVKFLNGNDDLNLVVTLTLKDDHHGNPVLTDVKSNVNGFNIDDIKEVAIATNDIKCLVRQIQERWLQHFPILSEMDLLIKQHAVDWIQEENKLRVLSKCGKIMFTLNIPKNYPNSRDITLDNACGLDNFSEAELPKPPASLLQWVQFLEEKYGDS